MQTHHKGVVFLVGNIPKNYHSSDLRNFFSEFIENCGFSCFHFKHRPEHRRRKDGRQQDPRQRNLIPNLPQTSEATDAMKSNTYCCIVIVQNGLEKDFVKAYHGKKWTDVNGRDLRQQVQLSCIHTHEEDGIRPSENSTDTSRTMDNTIGIMDSINGGRTMETMGDIGGTTDDTGGTVGDTRGTVGDTGGTTDDTGGTVGDTGGTVGDTGGTMGDTEGTMGDTEGKMHNMDDTESTMADIGRSSNHERCSTINFNDLLALPELNPPSLMPRGNVGTPLSMFMDLIKACKLPSHVIKKLKLNFQISKKKKLYGAVPMVYSSTNSVGTTGSGYQCPLESHTDTTGQRSILVRTEGEGYGDDNDGSSGIKRAHVTRDDDKDEDDIPEDDDFDAEEWERYEALHEDVDKQERTSERLFESEMEVVWDKGSSGLVFYTDASYWDEQDGDFDEKCSKEDDWDVDMSLYYGYNSADRSALELRQMAVESKFRAENNQTEVDPLWKGEEGFGGKILKQKGWKEGSGLGANETGISEPLEHEGQHPTCKTGFGYRGEKITAAMQPPIRGNRRKRKTKDTLISTVYDKPEEEVDSPSRRAQPTTLKYRQNYIKWNYNNEKHPKTK